MFQRILVAVGGEDDAGETVPVVTGLADAFHAEVLVLHMRERVVTSAATIEQESIPESFRFGEAIAHRLVEAGIKATAEVDSHRPERLAEFVLAKADEFEAEMIVIGSHHSHNLKERVFGDLGRSLAHRTKCPLLLMPSGPD